MPIEIWMTDAELHISLYYDELIITDEDTIITIAALLNTTLSELYDGWTGHINPDMLDALIC